jgi:hypothetical protein
MPSSAWLIYRIDVTQSPVPAREHGLLLVVEDAHWADSATRELLDHVARRLLAQA